MTNLNDTSTNSKGRAKRPTNNHLRGAALEDMLRWQHNIYNSNRQALIWQNGVKSIVRRGTVIQLPSLPDFGGVITCMGGQYVSFDAKLIAGPRYHHPHDRLHQLSTLYSVQEAGGIAFLLVSIELERYFLLCPDTGWRDEQPLNLRLDRLERRQGIEFGRSGSYGLPDWLSVVQAVRS